MESLDAAEDARVSDPCKGVHARWLLALQHGEPPLHNFVASCVIHSALPVSRIMGPMDEQEKAQAAPGLEELGDLKTVAAAYDELADAEEDDLHEQVVVRGNPVLR